MSTAEDVNDVQRINVSCSSMCKRVLTDGDSAWSWLVASVKYGVAFVKFDLQNDGKEP